jgi:mannosyltransferase OCH1-like enzyme
VCVCDRFINTSTIVNHTNEVGRAYDCVQIGAVRADVWRLLLIYRYGGFYFDLDSRAKARHPFREWGLNDAEYIAGGKWGHQWGIIFRAGHPVLRTAVERWVKTASC